MKDTTVLYQHGTLATLVAGLLEGTTTAGALLQHVDTGIGTGEGLDGELIILNGQAYKVDGQGQVTLVPDSFKIPFANAHFADFTDGDHFEKISSKAFQDKLLKEKHLENIFFAVQAQGTFQHMKTRVVEQQQPPYPTLAEIASQQKLFEAINVSGTLIGYYSPDIFNGVSAAGYHIHFLADDHSIGGHVLDYTIKQAKVQLQVLETLEQHLPVQNAAYLEHDFAQHDIIGDIARSE
ncbi:acetolactate decarboxylase [Sporolactobacillus sp. CPB3-1]|uniref:Alpha-acetolactate decarboxylase n=1 Tax=Sporolactobacillus mangiferae TaxID=2940498 RepID=A0ABT0M7D6_9BACL|nr:acetolactate decarboxylase [Sporolactobacillus mangiferae]MCL1630779.1 acetolactate decarboxylase [Sporolactobacillus mangiferae]